MKEKDYSQSWLPTQILTIVFVVLKLCHVIDWSWWWVLSPLWINVLMVILVSVVYVLYKVRQTKKRYKK